MNAKSNIITSQEPEPTTYSVVVVSQTSRQMSGGPVIDRKCGHEHKTIAAAERCRRSLTKSDFEGWICASWGRAAVRHSDGSQLSNEEGELLNSFRK